mmetsp:Transcript_10267/g.18930  ORF Transcript_10267/g.18930 Transcript_10267/m.18930 type:complete len:84 (+) Transcript_10267:594-845(+)
MDRKPLLPHISHPCVYLRGSVTGYVIKGTILGKCVLAFPPQRFKFRKKLMDGQRQKYRIFFHVCGMNTNIASETLMVISSSCS